MSRRQRVALAGAVLAVVVMAAACGGSDGSTAAPPTTTAPPASGSGPVTAPAGGPDLAAVRLKLTKVGTFDQPVAMAGCLDEEYVAEKGGAVRRFADGEVVTQLDVSDGNEQGLLGLTCSNDHPEMFVSYTDSNGDSRVDALPQGGGEPLRTLFRVDQPAPNHNGGNIVFGPDGLLWLGLGDGGGADDRFDNAQEPGEVLGSILRLDPADPKPEIVVKGVRNPWRFSFDRDTGDLWIGDVGQNRFEEIDRLRAGRIEGANLGWPAFEGTERHREDVKVPPGVVEPVLTYGRGEGQSVVGGFVYRGTAIPALRGAYVFTDTYAAVLRAIVVDDTGKVTQRRELGDIPGGQVSSFAEGSDGQLFVLSLAGGIYRLDPG